MTQNIANLCVRCEDRFTKWADYHAHVTANTCHRRILPVNISGRSKAEIVKSWESQQKEGAIIQ